MLHSITDGDVDSELWGRGGGVVLQVLYGKGEGTDRIAYIGWSH